MSDTLVNDYIFEQSPNSILPYMLDYSGWLMDGDFIVTSTWEADEGIDIEVDPEPSHTSTATVVWLSGGTLDHTYMLTNRIVTDNGLQDEKIILMTIRL